MRVSERNRRPFAASARGGGPVRAPLWFRLSLSIYGPAHRLDSSLEPILAHWREGSCYEISMSDRVKAAKIIVSRVQREGLDVPVQTGLFAQCRRS